MAQLFQKFSRARELASFLFLQRVKGFEIPDEPHFDPEFDLAFRERLARSSQYLEFGTGGSTLLADRLGIPTLAIDSDRYFAAAVRKRLSSNSNVRIEAVDIGLTGHWGVPVPGTPTPARAKRWLQYVDRPFEVLKSYPDFALVDGRFRRACALKIAMLGSVEKCVTTIMFDDYFLDGREHYKQVERFLGTPQRIGRGALFSLTGTERVTEQDVSAAGFDYR